MSTHPYDNRPQPAPRLARARVTKRQTSPSLSCVPASWPYEEFATYLRSLMTAAGIADFAELHRLTGVSQTQFSNWRRGISQPSRENLKRITPALGLVSPVMLYIAAGLDQHEDFQIQSKPDFRVLPKPLQDLYEVYEQFKATGQEDMVLSSVRVLVDGLKAQVGGGDQPPGRRRRAS